MSKEAKTKDAPAKPKPAKPRKVQIVNNGAKFRTFCGVRIGLGVTAIDSKLADKIKVHSHYLNLKAQHLMSISDGPPETKSKTVVEAAEQVKQTHDRTLLDGYAAEDHRPEVLKAVREKHVELDKKPDASDED